MRKKRYKICILTLQGRSLTFHVDDYSIDEGSFLHFVDEQTGRNLRFHASRAEIEEVRDQ